jgi:hypothetical protein
LIKVFGRRAKVFSSPRLKETIQTLSDWTKSLWRIFVWFTSTFSLVTHCSEIIYDVVVLNTDKTRTKTFFLYEWGTQNCFFSSWRQWPLHSSIAEMDKFNHKSFNQSSKVCKWMWRLVRPQTDETTPNRNGKIILSEKTFIWVYKKLPRLHILLIHYHCDVSNI